MPEIHPVRTVAYFSQPVDMGTDGPSQRREPRPHHLRDYHAIVDVHESVRRSGDRILRLINVNHADLEQCNIQKRLRCGDLIVQACRVWRDEYEAKKKVPHTGAWLEGRLLDAHEQWFSHCSRKRISLTPKGAEVLAPEHEMLADLEFSLWPSADYSRKGRKRTAGYVVFSKELWPGGPDCVNVFGVSGPITLGLAAAIRDRCRDEMVFRDSELIFIEIWSGLRASNLVPDPTPGCLDYWADWVLALHRKGHLSPVLYHPKLPTPRT